MRYLALLRGVNVGGKNIVNMAELRTCFERMGCKDVSTFIQSGNVLFESVAKDTASLSSLIENAVSEEFAYGAVVVLVSQKQLVRVIKKAPPAFGADPAQYRYDVVFVKSPLCAREVLPTISLKEQVDEAFEGNGVLYFKRLISRASQSHLAKLTTTAAYKSMTIRNWNTTTRLSQLL